MADSDVVAIVANDLTRLHRKGWRVGDLLDFVQQHKITLVIADPQRAMDFSTVQGRLIAQLSAIFDEWYAVDVSLRRKADIAHRKSKGITVGRPPFGTRRAKDTGFLIPSKEGAWLMPSGMWQAGIEGERAPVKGAIWPGYYQCAERILTMCAGQQKRDNICPKLQDEGWAWRDGQGQPSPLENDDIRRVVANWPEYGGYVSALRARERHPSDYPPDETIAKLIPDRAVFPIDLLGEVARSRQKRALGKHPTHSVNAKALAYPLAGMTYCAHCEQLAERNQNPKLRSMLSGRLGKYYRHKQGAACGCERKSIQRAIFEQQFINLVRALTVSPESVQLMAQLALRLNADTAVEQQNLEAQKAEAIALCRRRMDAAFNLYGDGRITREEYLRRMEQNEREVAHWELQTSDTELLQTQFALCINAVDMINKLWDISEDEDKQGMARHLFDYLVFDLDKQQIVDFRLKAWADQFLILRVGVMMEQYNGEDYDDNPLTLTGYQPSPRYFIVEFRIYRVSAPPRQQTDDPHKQHLREQVHELRARGLSYPDIAHLLDLSVGTVWNYANR